MTRSAILMAMAWCCAGAAADAAEAEPEWLQKARAREAAAAPLQDVRSTDGELRARVPARLLEKIKPDDDAYSVMLDIGAEAPISCELIKDGFDAAALLDRTRALTLEEVGEAQGKVEMHSIERIDAGVIGDSPFLAADWIYLVNDGKQKSLGALKQIAALKAGHGIYCAHADIGYAKTFRDVASAFIESVEIERADEPAEFIEIHLLRLGDSRVGFSQVRMYRDSEGDSNFSTTTSFIMPDGDGSIGTEDSNEVQWVRPDGSLINATYASADNGELSEALKLDQQEDGRWKVSGKVQGKDFAEILKGPGDPATFVKQARARAALLSQPDAAGRETAAPYWVSADPGRLGSWTFKAGKPLEAGLYAGTEALAGLTVETVTEVETGLTTQATMRVGPATLTIERALIRGRL